MKAVRYHVRHETTYNYDQPVRESHQLVRLRPRELSWQHCIAHHLEVSPTPTRVQDFVDSFGNPIHAMHIETSHDRLMVRTENWVEIEPHPMPVLDSSPPWESVRDALRYRAGVNIDRETLDAAAFLFESSVVRIKRAFADYAATSFPPGRPFLVAVDDLMRRIFTEFTFDPEATDVTTSVTEVFANRRGVCQDFAHFMISCLRSLGLPARYVSGYLLTSPPPGRPRLIGADATHAWVSVYLPGKGWFDFDPTNAVWPNLEHIVIGWGRDFTDISPLRGVLLGGGGHTPEISVTVVPEEEFTDLYTDSALPGLDLIPRAG